MRSTVRDGDADENIVRISFGVFREDIEVPVFIKCARIEKLELRLLPVAALVFLSQPGIRKLCLRVFVKRLHVGVRGRRIQVEVALLDVLAVIGIRPANSEQPLFQNGIAAVPQRQREAHASLAIANAEQAVFAPAIGAAARMIVREIRPATPIRGVVFAHGAPLPLGKIRAPALPVLLAPGIFSEPFALGAAICRGHQLLPSSTMMFLIPDRSKMGSRNASMG